MTIRQITAIMLFVTLVMPATVYILGWQEINGTYIPSISIYTITWIYLPAYWDEHFSSMGAAGGGLHVLEPAAMAAASVFCVFNILFAIQVVRYCKGDASRRSALFLGMLSFVFPLFTAWQSYGSIVLDFLKESGMFVYVGPIPIQLVVGLILLRYSASRKPDGPWESK